MGKTGVCLREIHGQHRDRERLGDDRHDDRGPKPLKPKRLGLSLIHSPISLRRASTSAAAPVRRPPAGAGRHIARRVPRRRRG
jgi:hypothetical protein